MTEFKGEASLPAWLDRHHVDVVRTLATGLDGQGVGKYVNRPKFLKTLPNGHSIADIALAMDLSGSPHLLQWHPFRHATLGDICLKPDLDTLISDGTDPNLGHVICDYASLDGTPIPLCPRTMLKNVVRQVRDEGFEIKATYELEFFLFADSFTEARQKRYRNLRTFGSSDQQTIYLVRNAYHVKPFMDEVLKRLDWYGIEWEGWNDENGQSQVELNLVPGDPIALADNTIRAKQVIYEVGVDMGLAPTFMAQPARGYANGLHIHHSLLADGEPAFYDGSRDNHRSALLDHWIAGLVATMPAAVSYLCPTINSFRRMRDFAAPPTVASWGVENKSAALRAMTSPPGAARLEHRLGASDMNPYLGLAVILAGGLAGWRHRLSAPDELQDLGWGLPARYDRLPNTIRKAADVLQGDTLLREVMGGEEIDYWVKTRKLEWFAFHTEGGDPETQETTPWEFSRYFEVV